MRRNLDPKYMARLYREQARAADDKITACRLMHLADEYEALGKVQQPPKRR